MSEYKLPLREDVKVEDTWDLTTIFPDLAAWEKEFDTLQELVKKADSFRGTLGNSAKSLLAVQQYRDEAFQRVSRLYVYARLQEDTDTRNPEYQALNARAKALVSQLQSAFSFYQTELLAIPEDTVAKFLEEEPELAVYKHEFDELYLKGKYVLSEREEEILAEVSEVLDSSSTTFAFLNNADIVFPEIKDEKGKTVQLSHGLYGKLLESQDRKVREAAFRGVYETYGSLKNTLSSTLTGAVKADNFNATIRGFDSARHAALTDNVIPESVYDSLIEAVNEKLPALHKYVALRQKALGVDDIRMYDLYVPMVEDVDMSFTYEQAQQLVLEGLGALGEEYQSIVQKAFDERWIDPIENQGKRSGAYSSGTYGTNPYILLNWQDTLDNVFTLAHELGHSVHSYYTRKNQPYTYGNYSIFLAEVASTTNENLLTEYLLEKYDDPAIRAYVINHYLDGVKGTVYRQTQFAEFEHLIHKADQEGTPLTAEFLSQEYAAINKKYYGEQMTYDDEISMEWARIPHFYYNYYVYQYATGFSAASALSAKILAEGEPALKAYTDFLKAGSSDYPIEVLKKAGIDMTTNKPVLDALSVFEERLKEMDSLL